MDMVSCDWRLLNWPVYSHPITKPTQAIKKKCNAILQFISYHCLAYASDYQYDP